MKRAVAILSRWLESLSANLAGTLTHVATEEPVAALTFDDGPHPNSTPRLLEILSRHRAQATFFMLGEKAERHPALVRQVAEAGHVIGNHSWDHASFPLIPGCERRAQIRACAAAIAPYGQKFFRPPYGHQNTSSRLDILWLRHSVVAWSLDGEDWLDHDANRIADRLTSQIRKGSIVLLHDTVNAFDDGRHASREPMLQAVEMFLKRMGGRFRFITVPDLLRQGRPQWRNWISKADPERLNRLRTERGDARRYAV